MHWPMTKAQMLKFLKERLTAFQIPVSHSFTVQQWEDCKEDVLKFVEANMGGRKVAIRSSAIGEDGNVDSMAENLPSILNVDANDSLAVSEAFDEVIQSYVQKSNPNNCNEILVQEMAQDVSVSGVLFTCDLNTGAPYYVINYDDVSGLTTTVTAGTGSASNKLLYVYRDALDRLKSPRFFKLVSAVVELERVLDCQLLDVEFAIDENETPILLQVRRITTHETLDKELASDIEHRIGGVESFPRRRLWASVGHPWWRHHLRPDARLEPRRDHRPGAEGAVNVPVSRADHEQRLEGGEVRDGLSRACRAPVDGVSRRAALYRRQAEPEFLPPQRSVPRDR